MLWQLRIRIKYIMNKPRMIYGYKNVLHTHLDIQVLSTCWGWGELMWQLLSTVSSVQFSHSVVSNSWQPHRLQHTRLPCRLVTPGPCSRSCPLSRWCHPTISSSVVPFSSRLQSFAASGGLLIFQSCGHCWVFQICSYIECSTFTASSFRIWNSSTGIPSSPLALFIVMLPKAHLTLHSECLALGEWSHHCCYLGHGDLFV